MVYLLGPRSFSPIEREFLLLWDLQTVCRDRIVVKKWPFLQFCLGFAESRKTLARLGGQHKGEFTASVLEFAT
jgi:hypothetical protein